MTSDPQLIEVLHNHTLVPFVGADLPEAVTGLPSRADLARGLAQRHNLDVSSSLAQVAQRVSRAGNRFDFTDYLRRELDTAGAPIPAFYQNLAAFAQAHDVPAIITTAYHDQLERALRDADVPFDRIVRGSDVAFARPDRLALIKLYGDVQMPDTLVVTEDDHYGLGRDRDKEDVLDEVRGLLKKQTVLFLGYNLGDPDFNLLWREVLDRMGRFARTAYAVWPGLPEEERHVWRDRSIRVLETDPWGVLGSKEPMFAPIQREDAVLPVPQQEPRASVRPDTAADTSPSLRCFDLEIRIHARDADDGMYAVEASLGNGGHFTGGALKLDPESLREAALDPQAVGQHLSDALFAGPIRDAYLKAATYVEAKEAWNCLRLRLWIDRDAADLHTLSWELLRADDVLLSANAATPFSRYLPATTPWETDVTACPLRVLAAISNPVDLETYRLSPVEVEVERTLLKEALADQDIQLDFLAPPVTLPRLEAKLREGYHVLHYVGHGAVGKKRGEPVLYLQQDDERAALVKGRQISAMLARQGVRPHLVVLAACESATVATADAYVALGPQLIQRGVPAVVAMRGKISQASAGTFSQTLYTRLLAHGVVDLAMNEARSTLLTAERPDAAVPVLFMRLKDGQLWQRENESPKQPRQQSVKPAQTTIHITGDGNVIGDHSSSQVVKTETTGLRASALRRRLRRLDSVEIESLCLDHFPRVYDKLSRGLRRDEMINLLLAHCRRHPDDAKRLDELL
jgi:phosphoglycolate phosphatase-like HAD superfamily hydrolase